MLQSLCLSPQAKLIRRCDTTGFLIGFSASFQDSSQGSSSRIFSTLAEALKWLQQVQAKDSKKSDNVATRLHCTYDVYIYICIFFYIYHLQSSASCTYRYIEYTFPFSCLFVYIHMCNNSDKLLLCGHSKYGFPWSTGIDACHADCFRVQLREAQGGLGG